MLGFLTRPHHDRRRRRAALRSARWSCLHGRPRLRMLRYVTVSHLPHPLLSALLFLALRLFFSLSSLCVVCSLVPRFCRSVFPPLRGFARLSLGDSVCSAATKPGATRDTPAKQRFAGNACPALVTLAFYLTVIERQRRGSGESSLLPSFLVFSLSLCWGCHDVDRRLKAVAPRQTTRGPSGSVGSSSDAVRMWWVGD
jgi:hypothetical protein